MMKQTNQTKYSPEKLSLRILYTFIVTIAISFGLFYLVGFNLPYLLNPSLNAPLFTDVVIIMMVLLFLVGLGCMAWSLIRGIIKHSKEQNTENNIPIKKIGYSVAGGTILILVITLLTGSTNTLIINGRVFTDTFWLKTSDMLINTSTCLLVIALLGVIYGRIRTYRKPQK